MKKNIEKRSSSDIFVLLIVAVEKITTAGLSNYFH
jgi:hypothetical protein